MKAPTKAELYGKVKHLEWARAVDAEEIESLKAKVLYAEIAVVLCLLTLGIIVVWEFGL